MDYFDISHEFMRAWEGGYVNNANDAGGATNHGVSLRRVVNVRDANGELEFDLDGDGDVDSRDIRLLDEHPEKVRKFYRDNYWDEVRGDEVRWPFCLYLFDTAVLHGPRAAVVMLQKAAGLRRDGIIGPKTIRAVASTRGVGGGRGANIARGLIRERIDFYHRLIARKPSQQVFWRGWLDRALSVHQEGFRNPRRRPE